MRSQQNIFSVDWMTVLLYVLLTGIGIAFIYSSTYDVDHASFFQFNTPYGKQFLWLCISVVVGMVIMIVDSKFYTSFAYVIFAIVVSLLIFVLLFGVEIKGSKSWFALGPIRFQPAELAKMATCLGLAKYLTGVHRTLKNAKDQIIALAIIGLPVTLILLQGDVGSAMVFLSLIFVLHREGLSSFYLVLSFSIVVLSLLSLLANKFVLLSVYLIPVIVVLFFNKKQKHPWIYVSILLACLIGLIFFLLNMPFPFLANSIHPHWILLILLIAISVVLASVHFSIKKSILPILTGIYLLCAGYTFSVDYIFTNILKQHHRDRINVLLGKVEDPSGVGYNVFQSKIAIGSGGFLGKGYLQGTQTQFNFVPEQSTDFIFCTIGEEFGFLGSLVLIGLFSAFFLRILFIAERQRSAFARIYGYGVVSILFFHFTVNICMTLGLFPVIGIPLPFISYGGSSLLAFSILLFILLRLDTQRLHVFR